MRGMNSADRSCWFPVTIGNRPSLAILHSTMTSCAEAASELKLLPHGGFSKVNWGLKQGHIDAGEQ
jgi:hypothetical protein